MWAARCLVESRVQDTRTRLRRLSEFLIGAGPSDKAVSVHEVLDGLLSYEARYWIRSAASWGPDVSVLSLVVAEACLIGSESECCALPIRIRDLDSAEGRGYMALWPHNLSHRCPWEGREWLSPLRPDRFAEHSSPVSCRDRKSRVCPPCPFNDHGYFRAAE
jgi:hypothetical protein